MRQIRRVLRIAIFVLVAGLLHYVLPQHDVARVISTEVIRTDFSSINRMFYAQADGGAAELATRDLRLINVEKKNTWLLGFWQRDSTEVMVYRNEDTGWIWPPYFKFDTANLQAAAGANVTTAGAEKWVVITHYGWRNKYISIYPNAIDIRPASGPDERVIPWFNIFFFVCLFFALLMIRAMWRQFVERTVDPTMEALEGGYDERKSRVQKWLDSWRKK
ncbi:DUF1523 family protein [Lentibacter algarum]|uniref:DUF1523 family protein n=1 Tax=Lentibacter algarum TaxID=576131 RepID=UPI001C0707B4|nr:DUF1523 family protein [Lentibacter algarum]MBU2981258.1 DUF1523 family protein [Lentibacter algarum]